MAELLTQHALQDLRTVAPEIAEAVRPFLHDRAVDVRLQAVAAMGRLGALLPSASIAGLLNHLCDIASDAAVDRQERAGSVLALGRMKATTSTWLTDADPALRVCAALTERTDPRSTPILLDALTRPIEIDAWFPHGVPLLDFQLRTIVLGELLDRGLPFATLLPVALAIARVTTGWQADTEWGLLLQSAFPDTLDPDSTLDPGLAPPPPTDLDDAQRAFLRALVANHSLWEATNGNARHARMKVGLPDSRAEVARIAGII
jgi:hypothetical protein